jgi:hypothetical protein
VLLNVEGPLALAEHSIVARISQAVVEVVREDPSSPNLMDQENFATAEEWAELWLLIRCW